MLGIPATNQGGMSAWSELEVSEGLGEGAED